jgi:N-acetylglucosaminyldiphosphoundecaprenol N-acetyl-beta-D-mannosaminyltransferase
MRVETAPNDRVTIIGSPFDRVSFESAIDTCVAWCRGPRSSHIVVTLNASQLCMMRRDSSLENACRSGDLIVADGVSVVWASRLLGTPVPERIAGVDFMKALLTAGSRERLRAYFLGAKREVVEKLAERCKTDFPGLVVAGFRDGYFGPADHPKIIEEIRASSPDLLFVGMPSPFKETWCEEHRERLNVPVIVGVGGSFDVLAGFIRRAPQVLQSFGMEWSWRLLMEPRKMWRRYLSTNSEFLWLLAGEVARKRFGGETPSR